MMTMMTHPHKIHIKLHKLMNVEESPLKLSQNIFMLDKDNFVYKDHSFLHYGKYNIHRMNQVRLRHIVGKQGK